MDDNNTANWLVVHKESSIDLKYKLKASTNTINQYKNIYMETDAANNINTAILVPDNYTSNQLSSIMNISLDIGEKLTHESFKIDTKLKSEFKDVNKNVIYVGGLSNTTPDFLNLLNEKEKQDAKDKAVIKQVISPFNKDRKMLMIISDNDRALSNATKLITSDKLIQSLNNESVTISESQDVTDLKGESNKSKVYLKDLGYDYILLKGPFTQETNFDIKFDKNKTSTEGSKLNLKFRYSKNLDFDRSLITIYANDKPIGSKKLSMQNADNDSLEINLPKDVLGKNYYNVKVVFNLDIKDQECVTRDTDSPWAYILDDSYIDLDLKDNTNLTFKSYPYPFVLNGEANDINIVVPKGLSSNELNDISNIVGYMGRDTKYNTGSINVLNDDEFLSSDKKGNLVVVGTPDSNKVIKDINKDLYIKFNDNFTGLESNEKFKFLDTEYSKKLSTLQLIDSPFDKNMDALVISSIDRNNLNVASRYLTDSSLLNTMASDAAVIDRDGKIENVRFKEVKTEDETKAKEKTKFKLGQEGEVFIVIAGFLFITILISTILLVLKYRK